MFGSIIRFAFRERAPWILFLRGMIGCVVFSLASMSQSQTLRNLSAPTIPNRSASPQVNFTQAHDPAGIANNPDTIRVVGLSPKSVYREAAAGHPLYYILSVSNLGNVEDQYTLSAVGNRWPLTLLSADSLTKIAMTAVVAPDSQFQFVVKLDVPGNAAIGTIDTVRMIVHSVGSPAVTDFAVLTTSSLGPAAGLPWIESFPKSSLDRVRWPYNSGPAAVNEKALDKPSPPYALNFDGYLLGGDEVRSQPINLAGKCDVVLLFAVERGGAGNAPENGDDFFVDYFNADGEWINLLVLPGGGPVMTSFSVESVVLPADACHSSFRFRFRNLASMGPFDDWYVDDVKVFEMARGRIPFVETFPTSTLNTDKWPVNTGSLVDTLGQNAPSLPFSANLKGNSILQTQPLDLSFQSAVAVTYYFQQQGFGDDPEAGDDLIVEFRDARGDWVLLAQHLGVTGSLPNFTRQELILPPAAYHRDFRLRFRATGDVGFDDWFVDDVTIDVFSPPEIEVTPTTLAATLFVGDSTMREFTIHNTGAGELFYRLRVAPASATTPNFKTSVFASAGSLPALKYPKDFYQIALKKNESDWRVGQRVLANSGGPDDFGYTWRDSREAGGPVFGWIDIAATGKRIGSQPDDDNVGPFDIGFAFPFYDSVFTKFRFCTNGFISFTSNSSRFTNDPLPGGGVGDLVAPFWDDLDLSAPQSAAYYLADGKRLIVQWTNVMSS
ncbi:MAG: hypothetical protein ONB44_23270, partial [candidate division KSB1 bacterium]|nr:hypothetical protein [candidate division KSB1 bacterium]